MKMGALCRSALVIDVQLPAGSRSRQNEQVSIHNFSSGALSDSLNAAHQRSFVLYCGSGRRILNVGADSQHEYLLTSFLQTIFRDFVPNLLLRLPGLRVTDLARSPCLRMMTAFLFKPFSVHRPMLSHAHSFVGAPWLARSSFY